MDGKSLNLREENIKQLNKIFPDVFSDGKIDLERLKDLVGASSFTQGEHYELTWIDKTKARQEIQKQTKATLKTDREGSIDFDTAQNVFIEGDNLEVLKILQKSYFGKVKMIYIDPPYNTGNDSFTYPDHFAETENEYLSRSGDKDEDGFLHTSDKWYKNSKDSVTYHSAWLSMMYPRLYLARNLLKEDGVIFISMDDHEQANLKLICDEIFGEENFIGQMIWTGGRKNDSKFISTSHEYILVYSKNIDEQKNKVGEWRIRKKGLSDIYSTYKNLRKKHKDNNLKIEKELKEWFKGLPNSHPAKAHRHYSCVDNNGVYFPDNISWPGGGGPNYEVLHPITNKPVIVPSRGWLYSKPSKMKEMIDADKIHFGLDENSVPCLKSYLIDRETQVPYSVLYQDGRASTKRLRSLMHKNVFEHPKDELVIKEFIEFSTTKNDIILDFFAGSSTTAQSILELNEEDGGDRKFIMVQIDEKVDEDSEAKKAGYDTIADISKARIRKVIEKLKKEREGKLNFEGKQELSFAAYKWSSSNFKQWNEEEAKEPDGFDRQLEMHLKSEKESFEQEDMVVELMLKSGYELTTSRKYYQPIPLVNVWSVNEGEMWIYLDKYKEDLKRAISEFKPKKVIFLDSCFQKDKDLANLRLELKELDIQSIVL